MTFVVAFAANGMSVRGRDVWIRGPDGAREWLRANVTRDTRYVVAFHGRRGILRLKTPEGISEWRSRPWSTFGGATPEIVEVTDSAVPVCLERAAWSWERRETVGIGLVVERRELENFLPTTQGLPPAGVVCVCAENLAWVLPPESFPILDARRTAAVLLVRQ